MPLTPDLIEQIKDIMYSEFVIGDSAEEIMRHRAAYKRACERLDKLGVPVSLDGAPHVKTPNVAARRGPGHG